MTEEATRAKFAQVADSGKTYLDYATRQARRHIPMTMEDWASKLDAFLQFNDAEILQDKVTFLAEIAEWPDEIDRNRAQEAKIRAERRLQNDKSNINITRAELALHKALVRIELADHVTK